MLDNFREVYDQELANLCSEGAFEELILSSSEVRMFVYEVCKGCIASEQIINASKIKTKLSSEKGNLNKRTLLYECVGDYERGLVDALEWVLKNTST